MYIPTVQASRRDVERLYDRRWQPGKLHLILSRRPRSDELQVIKGTTSNLQNPLPPRIVSLSKDLQADGLLQDLEITDMIHFGTGRRSREPLKSADFRSLHDHQDEPGRELGIRIPPPQ